MSTADVVNAHRQWHVLPPQQHPPVVAVAKVLGPSPRADEEAVPYGVHEPQAFLVEYAPNAPELGVHFHPVDQFQWFVRGSCRFGRHDVLPGTIHYADRHTPYGPLRPLEEGVSFLTLRGVSDAGAFFMPEEQTTLRTALAAEPGHAERRREVSVAFGDLEVAPGGWNDIVADADGLKVAAIVLEEGSRIPERTVEGAGGFVGVVRGRACVDGSTLDAGTLRWFEAGDRVAGGVTAAEEETTLGLFQLPRT